MLRAAVLAFNLPASSPGCALTLHRCCQAEAGAAAERERVVSKSPTGAGLPTGCLSAALAAVADGLHSSGGRVLCMGHAAPLVGAGRLRPREHPNDYGTDREQLMWRPLSKEHLAKEDRESGAFYAALADVCASRQVSVAFVLSDGGAYGAGGGADRRGGFGGFTDVATLGTVSRATGGSLHFFPGAVQHASTGTSLVPSVAAAIRGTVGSVLRCAAANEAVLKVRCSEGLRCVEYHGLGVQRAPEEIEAAAVDVHASLFCLLRHDGGLKPNQRCYLQAALLYSSPEVTALPALIRGKPVFVTPFCRKQRVRTLL